MSTTHPSRVPALAALLAGSLALGGLSVSSPGEARAPKLKEWVSRWLGNPPLAAGGTRGDPTTPPICLLHPWLLPNASPSQADLAVPRPVLVTSTPLRSIQLIHGNGRPVGVVTRPLSMNRAGTSWSWPSSWPSLEPGRTYQLKFEAATTGSTASILLRTASAEDFAQGRELQERLGAHPERWLETIQALLTTSGSPSNSSRALASQLLFTPEAPPSPALEELRQALRRGNCSPPRQP
jgi:hypothetical protein